jgi:hypothetical protein
MRLLNGRSLADLRRAGSPRAPRAVAINARVTDAVATIRVVGTSPCTPLESDRWSCGRGAERCI